MPTFDRLQIGLNGSTEPDNFTIAIYYWDVADTVANNPKLRTTVATGVTRTTVSAYNGGTLSGSNYGISGITGNDYYLKLTANNTCHTSATYSLAQTSLALSVHTQEPILPTYSSYGAAYGTVWDTGNPKSTTAAAIHDIGTFDDVFYLADSADPASPGDYTGYTNNFTFTHLGTYTSGGVFQSSGKWANGLLSIGTMTLEQSQSTPYKTYNIYAQQTQNIQEDGSGTVYYSQYRITYNPSNTSRTFTFWFAGASV